MKLKVARTLALGAALSLAMGSSALAQQFNWTSCDGYGAASRGGDGMTNYANVFLIFNPPGYGNTARSDVGTGASAIDVCSRALDSLPAAHWKRRINLLQARALHRAAAGQGEAALADLDLADAAAAAGQADPLFERSQRVGLMLARGYVLDRMGRKDEARQWLAQAREARPYDRGVASVAANLTEGDSTTSFSQDALISRARLDPRTRATVAMRLFDEGRFEEFLALSPYLVAPEDYPEVGELPVSVGLRELENHERKVQFKAMFATMAGYALTAGGRYDEAEQAFSEARAHLAAGRQTPAPPTLRGAALEQYSGRLSRSWARISEIQPVMDDYERAAERRRMVAEGKAEEVIASLDREPLVGDATGVDTLLAIAATLPPEEAPMAQTAAENLRAQIAARAERAQTDVAVRDVFAALPIAETEDRLSAWREAKRPMFAMRGSPADLDSVGYRESTTPDGMVTVRFRGGQSPRNQVEEMALLRAAELARQGGHAGFLLLERRDTEWSTHTTQYGMTLRSDPNGYETEIDIRFVDTATPDAEGGMILAADDVYARLAPVYIREAPRRR